VSRGAPSNLDSFQELVRKIEAKSGKPWDEKAESEDRYLGRLKQSNIDVHQLTRDFLNKPGLTHNPLHRNLLRIFREPANVKLVTTNFDGLFELAAQSIWKDMPEVFRAPALPLGSSLLGLVHVHGALTRFQEIVLTDADFGRAYLIEGWARRFLVDLFSKYTVLFVGYGHNDTVMNYLARALPAGQGERYALVDDKSKLDHWKPLGIHAITFPHTADFKNLDDSVKSLADFAMKDILDWQKDLSEIALKAPFDKDGKIQIDLATEELLRYILKEKTYAQFFANVAKDPGWMEWLDHNQFFEGLYRQADLTETETVWANWIVYNMALQSPEACFRLLGKHRRGMHQGLLQALLRQVGHPNNQVDQNTFERWVSLLVSRKQ